MWLALSDAKLERAGYDVRYQEFEDGHVVPPEIGSEHVCWFNAEQNRRA